MPSFADIEIEGERRTAIRLVIEDRQRRLLDQPIVVPATEEPEPALAEVQLEELVRPEGNGHRLN